MTGRGSPRRREGAEGRTGAPCWPGAEVPPGSKSAGVHALGFPRNLGDLVVSVDKSAVGKPQTKTQAPGGASPAQGSEIGTLGRYRRVKATKRGGTGGEESECLV